MKTAEPNHNSSPTVVLDNVLAPPGSAFDAPYDEGQLLRTVALEVGGAVNLTAAVQAALREVCTATGWVLGQAWLRRPGSDVIECGSAFYDRTSHLRRFVEASRRLALSPGVGLPGMAWASARPVWCRDASLDQDMPRWRVAREAGLKAGMAVPVPCGQEVLAVLEFFGLEEREADQALIQLVAGVAAQLGPVFKRKQVEESLRRNEARYRAVVDTAVEGIITMSAGGIIESFNRGAERIFGYEAKQVVGRPLTLLMPQRYQALHTEGLRRYLETGTSHILGKTQEVAGLRKDGTELPLELTVTSVPQEDEPLFAGILRDMSEQKRLEMERAQLLAAEQATARRMQDLAALKADFTAMVAHELASPIGAVRGLTMMLASGKLGPEEQARALSAIKAEMDALSKLVADVRGAASAERDDFDVHLRPVPLSRLIATAEAFAAALVGDHPIVVAPVPDVIVLADPDRIGQVLRNLLTNAAKHTPAGSEIQLRTSRKEQWARIEVMDQGPGIHPEDLARIFEKFARGRDQLGHVVAGVGLGLYLSRRIVQAHGSDLKVESIPGKGSTFGFELEAAG